ncbi:hypothetical protein CIJ84_02300 [Neisseria meningitidis]|uniref:Phage associated protein n=1 Tax=Neisseria meningitidis TaxID=487 RepID=A0AB37K9K3_NEIME|nr:hypothetical protein [Neisseria meningitidis]MBW3919949.1 DUF3310 domain-containing protein [Neisseria meningitidis]RGB18725.1 hypothetical protein CIJ84_02300 [Neisseria meningitidis]CBY91543.1 putative phage associated protein [Neisseria meningitidis WUE 2594]CWO15844.1 putative phage associated protein [Neisseria meningitidis]CWS28645.1 putative phage associated protein [Neisseria meningitidis]
MTTPTPKTENPNRYRALDLSCTEFTQHLNFHLGSAFKYIFLHKEDGGREDLEKALWHLRRQRNDAPKFKKLKRKSYFKLSQKLESCGFDTGTDTDTDTGQALDAILYAASEYDEDGIAWAIAYVRTLLKKMPPETEQASHSESPMPPETERGGI